VDTLINNAGAFLPKPFTEYTESEFTTLLQVNLGGFFHVSQSAIAEMLRRESGHIVNITSSLLAEQQPLKGLPAALTAITKGGVNAVTRSLAIEYADKGIRVNAVALPARSALPCVRAIRMLSLQRYIRWVALGKFRRSSTRFSISKMQPLSPERFCTSMAAPTQAAGDRVKASN
jgi:NAD(P)-dependent dehydrogenase (short-subunit alcohol dehydrogenase family)